MWWEEGNAWLQLKYNPERLPLGWTDPRHAAAIWHEAADTSQAALFLPGSAEQ